MNDKDYMDEAYKDALAAYDAGEYPVGAVLGTHHGLTNAVFMPYVMVFNRPAIEERVARLAAYLGFADPSFEALLDWILEFPNISRPMVVQTQF